ncbi:cell surface hyaluronidase-like [Mya arenaria]|uniref:cell surface hyaluronidase-like n=1 Tax=Mya arenaria TaxID=6604 RepID=UPI0022E250AC|nr:cell surface hyaluronidase-like [Mya arenaria]
MVTILALFLAGILTCVLGDCPHTRSNYKRWSNDADWLNGRPIDGENLVIVDNVIIDSSTPDFHNVTILSTGSLTFDPEVDLKFRAANIMVDGRFEIGNDDCPYKGKLEITLTGTREDHMSESNGKSLLVRYGGKLEIHGQPKRSWTKLTATLKPDSENTDVVYDHTRNGTFETVNSWVQGLGVYTFADTVLGPVVRRFGMYDLQWHGLDLVKHLESVKDGEILLMASQKDIRKAKEDKNQFRVYDALETLIYGEPTGKSILRRYVQDGSTWAFAFQKGNPLSLREVTSPLGVTSQALFYAKSGLIYSAEALGNSENVHDQNDNFRVAFVNGIFPLVNLVGDVTTWLSGDRIAIASTDYGGWQAEEAEVVFCDDCSNTQIRINKRLKYTHWGEFVASQIDMRGEVAMLSRNIVIQGEMLRECPSFNGNCEEKEIHKRDTFGAHIKILNGFGSARMSNFEMRYVGQHTDKGRYPIHFHMALDRDAGVPAPYVRSVSIHNSFARCITLHGTHSVQVIDNVCYDHLGHGYFLEDGGEKNNTFDGNLAMNTRKGTGFLEPMDKERPAGFWITNPKTYFRNNVAAGGEGMGIWVVYPNAPLGPSAFIDPPLMKDLEAQRTPFSEFVNNAAHSQDNFGVFIGGRLKADRTTHCCNMWQPRVNTSDPDSEPLIISLSKITGYKCRFINIWIEGGLLDVSRVSSSDALNGVMVTNEGQQFVRGGKLSNAVIVGESQNKGVPIWQKVDIDRALPFFWEIDAVQSGLTMWKGPMKFNNLWFDGFHDNERYDIAAIAQKRNSPYFSSMKNTFTNITFAFIDGPGHGQLAISGVKGVNPGWDSNRDGEMIAGFTLKEGDQTTYVVRPDDFSAAADDCVIRRHWRLARCRTKFGNLQVHGNFEHRRAIFVRDQLPSAQLDFEMHIATGPQVVLDGSSTYTVHFKPSMGDWIRIEVNGLDEGDKLRIGVCTPLSAEVEIQSLHPFNFWHRSQFLEVASLEELDRDEPGLDGKKVFFDTKTGMMYYKFINLESRHPDEDQSCNNGKCPEFRVRVISGDYNDSDCRSRLYTAKELARTRHPPLHIDDSPIFPTAQKSPPPDFGAGSLFPFEGRVAIDGGWSNWGVWSQCSLSCGEGTQYRQRQCSSPLPDGEGAHCAGLISQVRSCIVKHCPINGEFTEWTRWSKCKALKTNEAGDCNGRSGRKRSCTKPATRYNGEYCAGSILEVKPCLLPGC